MAKKKPPEVRLLLGGELTGEAKHGVLFKVQLLEKEIRLVGYTGTKTSWIENGGETKDYDSLGVAVLSKREHSRLKRAAETLDDIRVQLHDILSDEDDDSDREDLIEGVHNAAARALSKPNW